MLASKASDIHTAAINQTFESTANLLDEKKKLPPEPGLGRVGVISASHEIAFAANSIADGLQQAMKKVASGQARSS
jgi:hypothetical protein